jgi:organic radical activating enzyme
VYKSTVSEIKRQARANGFTQFHWSFSGGEPTAYRHLLDLIKHLDDGVQTPYQSVHMTTNLSPGSKWWNTWCKNTEMLQRRSITASFHDEFAKEQEFGDKCLQLQYELVHVTVNQVMVPDKFWETLERCQRFKSRGINVTLKPQSDPTASFVVSGYTDEMIRIMQEEFQQQVSGEQLHQIRLSDGIQNYYIDQAERFNAFNFNAIWKRYICNTIRKI